MRKRRVNLPREAVRCKKTQVFQETKSQIKKAEKASRRQVETKAYLYQDLFPYITDATNEKWNTLKQIPRKE